MASIEFIQKRIESARTNIEKLQKKLVRIEKAEASNWEENPYYYDESDKRRTQRDIDDAQNLIAKYEADIATTVEKDNSRDVKVIIDFLENWKKRVFDYYNKAIKAYYADYAEIGCLFLLIDHSKMYVADDENYNTYNTARLALRCKVNGYFEERAITNRWGKPDTTDVKVRDGEYEYAKEYLRFSTYDEAIARLNKDLTAEAKRKYDFIIERVNAICGTITDASNLTVGAKEDLNGFIIGDRGTASVKTIGAGGYNEGEIVNVKHGQCFHFRTLIHKI